MIVIGEWELALKTIKEEDVKLVLLDIILPDKNGFEILEEIKKDEATKDIPVIMLSNLAQDSDIQKSKDMGAVNYLVKANLSLEEITDKIREYAG